MLISVSSSGRGLCHSDEIIAILEIPKKAAPNADPQKATEVQMQTVVFVRGVQMPIVSDMDPQDLGIFVNAVNEETMSAEAHDLWTKMVEAKNNGADQ